MFLKVKKEVLLALEKALSHTKYFHIDDFSLCKSKNSCFGDLTTNLPLVISSKYKKNLKEVGDELIAKIPKIDLIEKIELAKNGFINFFFKREVFEKYYLKIVHEREAIGRKEKNNNQVCVEIISANPNGSLHIGHIRNGILSDTIANLFEFCGYTVIRPYLVNDCGSQIFEMVKSVWAKYQRLLFGQNTDIDYEIKYDNDDSFACAQELIAKHGSILAFRNIFEEKDLYETVRKFIVNYFISKIKKNINDLKIAIDFWHYESNITTNESINGLLQKLKLYLYMKESAVWFKTSEFDDTSTDDVVVKKCGSHTYFTQDIAYHIFKFSLLNQNGKIINIFACDHEGHVKRMKASLLALNYDLERIVFKETQLVKLSEGNKKLIMSKRNNTLINYDELKTYMSYEEIRWFFVSKEDKSEIDIDIKKLKEKNYNNPIFYVLYAYARIEQIAQKFNNRDVYEKEMTFETINSPEEIEIMHLVNYYDEVIENALETLNPNIISNYLFSLAKEFHSFYEKHEILKSEDKKIKNQRLGICFAIKSVLFSGLSIFKIIPKRRI